MKWFKNDKKRLEMIQGIRPTSKTTLKMQCLLCCKGDVNEAMKLYDFFAKDMANLPDYDPVAPTWIDNTKDMANGIFGWLKENQDTLAQGYEFVRSIVQNKGALPAVADAADSVPLEPIN
jgi:hypothetical protein